MHLKLICYPFYSKNERMRNMNIEMANRLTALRKRHELSQEQLAEKLGVSRQAVSKWERAEASPDIENLSSLAKLYGITIDELVNGVQEPSAPHDTYTDAQESGGVPDTTGFSEGITVTYDESPQNDEPRSLSMSLLQSFPFIVVVLIAFFLTGFLCDLWYINWVLFLLIPCWYGMVRAVKSCRPDKFPYPVFVAAVYLVMGFLCELWHPGWVVFLTIPIYYWIADTVRKNGR